MNNNLNNDNNQNLDTNNEQPQVINPNDVNDALNNDQQEQSSNQDANQQQTNDNHSTNNQRPQVVKQVVEHQKEVVKQVEKVSNNKDKKDKDNNSGNDNNKKEVVVQEKGKAFQYFLTVILFILLGAFIFFLPQIREYFLNRNSTKEILSGVLSCSKKVSKDNLTYNYQDDFYFTKEKLKNYNIEKTVSSNSSESKQDVQDLDTVCKKISEEISNVDGATNTCSLINNKQKTKQSFDLTILNVSDLTSAFAEAGAIYPEFTLDEDINKIETKMQESGYICTKKA